MDRTEPCRPVGVDDPRGANSGTSSIFPSFNRLEPSRMNRTGPWPVLTRGPPKFKTDRTNPHRLQNTIRTMHLSLSSVKGTIPTLPTYIHILPMKNGTSQPSTNFGLKILLN
jgi:hypothetical protein